MESQETLHILVFEDDENFIEIFPDLVELIAPSLGISVVLQFISDFDDAMNKIVQNSLPTNFTAILVDGNLDETTTDYSQGGKIITALRQNKNYANIPTIGISATSNKPEGADQYIQKSTLLNLSTVTELLQGLQSPR